MRYTHVPVYAGQINTKCYGKLRDYFKSQCNIMKLVLYNHKPDQLCTCKALTKLWFTQHLLVYLLSFSGSLPLSVSALSPRVQDLHKRVCDFINNYCLPLEAELFEFHSQPETKWKIHPKVEELKVSILYNVDIFFPANLAGPCVTLSHRFVCMSSMCRW